MQWNKLSNYSTDIKHKHITQNLLWWFGITLLFTLPLDRGAYTCMVGET